MPTIPKVLRLVADDTAALRDTQDTL